MTMSVRRKAVLAGSGAAAVLALGIAVPAVAFAQDPSDGAATPSATASPLTPEQRRAEHQQKLAEALAAELGISPDKVAAALEKVHAQFQADAKAEHLTRLKAQLDAAVAAGKLTQAQADAILKAAEAGVLPGPGLLGGPGGPHGPGAPGR